MNLKEGTRRLALLLGVAGAIGGGCGSYLELREVLAQKARHDEFEQLANLGEVQNERKCRLLGYGSGCFRMKLPPGASLVEQEQKDPYAATAEPPSSDGPAKFRTEEITPIASELDTSAIKTVNWAKGKEYDVASIEMEDGLMLYPTVAPSARLYLIVCLLPLVAFVIPWGAIRAIGWVGAGFVASSK